MTYTCKQGQPRLHRRAPYHSCAITSLQNEEGAPEGGHALCRVSQIVQYIHSNSPKTKIVLLGILPRGAQYWDKDQAWLWPNRYTAAIAAVNAGYYVSDSVPCF